MKDLIYRQQAIDELRACQTYLFDTHDKDEKISLESAEYCIEQLPSAQPERKRDTWGADGECPFCGYLRQWDDDNFCANCGADMRGESE